MIRRQTPVGHVHAGVSTVIEVAGRNHNILFDQPVPQKVFDRLVQIASSLVGSRQFTEEAVVDVPLVRFVAQGL